MRIKLILLLTLIVTIAGIRYAGYVYYQLEQQPDPTAPVVTTKNGHLMTISGSPLTGFCPYLPPFEDKLCSNALIIDTKDIGIKMGLVTEYWDIDNDDLRESVDWIMPDYSFLARDLNHDGIINNHAELFGTTYISGYQMLKDYDTNHDDVIDASDPIFADLRIWNDIQPDGISQPNEVKSLADYHVTAINLKTIEPSSMSNGRKILTGFSFTRSDGSQGRIVDAIFMYDNLHSVADKAFPYNPQPQMVFKDLPEIRGHGDFLNLQTAMAHDPMLQKQVATVIHADLTQLLDPAFDLRGKVKEIMFTWANATDRSFPQITDPSIDKREIAFEEKYWGRDFTFNNGAQYLAPDMLPGYAKDFRGDWENIYLLLRAQTKLYELTDDVRLNPETGLRETREKSRTDMAKALLRIRPIAQRSSDPFYVWQETVRYIRWRKNIRHAWVQKALHDAIGSSLPGYTLTDLIKATNQPDSLITLEDIKY